MTTKWKRINVLTVALMGFLLSHTTDFNKDAYTHHDL